MTDVDKIFAWGQENGVRAEHGDRMPRASRRMPTILRAICEAIKHDLYLTMTEEEFVAGLMHLSHGVMRPEEARATYRTLMDDAGLPPL